MLALVLILVLLFSGCTTTTDKGEKDQQTDKDEKQKEQEETEEEKQEEKDQEKEEETELIVQESATKIYLGMLETGLEEVVVDVQENKVLIAFMEDKELSNTALIYYAFGLSQKFEPEKEKTTVLIFSDEKTIEAGVDNLNIKALTEGTLSEEQFKKKIRWVE